MTSHQTSAFQATAITVNIAGLVPGEVFWWGIVFFMMKHFHRTRTPLSQHQHAVLEPAAFGDAV
ncbi:MAG TPA: hypothetical protein DHV01_00945 [Rhodoferax sp.]|nr:MAG: hypothetical protein A2037_04275 [Curvibacter sp. GWA2_63_95]HCX80149.1 hypothetical protein [Rhodoferax sp.]